MARRVYPISRNWLYSETYTKEAVAPAFNDRAFRRVTIPHTNRLLPWHGFDDRDYQFVSVYRRRLTLPDDAAGRRVFVEFDGVMTAATVYLNGARVGGHRGGYTPFSVELTDRVRPRGHNLLAVKVDSRERADIPPFGGRIDYLTFGGIYRDVRLHIVSPTFIDNVFARPRNVMGPDRSLEVRCRLDHGPRTPGAMQVDVELRDDDRTLAAAKQAVTLRRSRRQLACVTLTDLPDVELWDLDNPKMYDVRVRLRHGRRIVDEMTVRTGFRDARFTPDGFHLNGRHVKLRGLNRHQTYPFVGQAMPDRVQRRDALILKRELKCNVVRTSHYPQSPAFLDACDEVGLLVFEEIPGWQHIGDERWQHLACRNVEEMIERDHNHPSIILWGVRINESGDNHDFYARTNAIAHEMDDSRQTGGVRCFFGSELIEDVYTVNDFNPFELRAPTHDLYLNTEFCGHMFPTKHADNVERVQEHVLRHARVHDMLAADDRYAGGIGWCAFDYNTHRDFGSGDRVCYHGVSDIFRIPKPAAGFYRSQCDPAEEVVLEPAFHWTMGDRSVGGLPDVYVCSNCDRMKFYVGDELLAVEEPDREQFPHLPHPPFRCRELGRLWGARWLPLRIEGYLGRRKVIERTLSHRGVDAAFEVHADDAELLGDGRDATRVVFRVTDEYGAARPFATDAIEFDLAGPGEIVGDNPFPLVGGCGAIWVKAAEASGTIRLTARHPVLGAQTVRIKVRRVPPEIC